MSEEKTEVMQQMMGQKQTVQMKKKPTDMSAPADEQKRKNGCHRSIWNTFSKQYTIKTCLTRN